jgi:hypothetical protein
MKTLFLFLSMFLASTLFAQTYELPENGSIMMDSALTIIVDDIYYPEMYSDITKIEYYDKRIQDVMIKYYHVIENEFEEANANGWFLTSFKPALDRTIEQRKNFLKTNN